MTEVLSLYELNQLIREAIGNAFPRTFLVTAEIASCDVKNHCYLTLVDKEDDAIRAEIRAVIWANRYKVISRVFKEATGSQLSKGIKILFEAEVSFHERYGLKLNILNVDPSYTIGELAVKRKEILDRLTKEGLVDKNRSLEFPLVPQRIAIISSSTAAGYEDLMSHLTNNSYGYKFTCKLHEAIMQGDRAEASIVSALGQCAEGAEDLDIVLIVRGGGGQIDLHCFDSYEIGKAIAMLPLPVISGIGHHRDITVVDEVSNKMAKTPTAVADMIITRVKDFEDSIDDCAHRMVYGTNQLTIDMKDSLSELSKRLEIAVRQDQIDNVHNLDSLKAGLRQAIRYIQNEKERLRARESNVHHLNPRNVLKRGYSITYKDGKALKSMKDVEVNDSLTSVLHEGELISIVTKKMKGRKR
jgi:exodeoxyribonuclease VII large subunit